jgi:hypothetical protein
MGIRLPVGKKVLVGEIVSEKNTIKVSKAAELMK